MRLVFRQAGVPSAQPRLYLGRAHCTPIDRIGELDQQAVGRRNLTMAGHETAKSWVASPRRAGPEAGERARLVGRHQARENPGTSARQDCSEAYRCSCCKETTASR